MGISVSERPGNDAREAVLQALLARRVPAGHWEGHLSSSALATATAVTALATAARAGVAGADAARLVDKGVGWLLATRNQDGGWGDTPDSRSNISTTALVWAALSFARGDGVREAETSAAAWLTGAAGGAEPRHLARALGERYGKDRTFSVPILTMCALAGRLGPPDKAWDLIPQLPFELSVLPRSLFGALRLPVVSYALPALISMGLARHRAGRAVIGLSAIRERAAARALRVLDTLQPPTGGFLEAVPLTSFVAMSLIAAGEHRHAVVARGLEFLRQSVRADGSWPIDTNLATWVTTLSVNALGSGGAGVLSGDERAHLRDWLLAQQWTVVHPYTGAAPGGWAWTDLPGGVPDADDTAGALVALAHLDKQNPQVLHAAAAGVQWLLDLQNRDGGIPTFCRGWGTLPFDRSSSDLTAHALRAWQAWSDVLAEPQRVQIRRAIDRALGFLETVQREDGMFVPLWFGNQYADAEENPVFGTSRVLKGLAVVSGAGASRARRMAGRAMTALLGAQNSDGGWGAAPGVPSSIEETAVAVSALAACSRTMGTPAAHAIGKATAWLETNTGSFHRFPAAPIGLYFARLWYSEELYPLIFAAGGLIPAHDTAGPPPLCGNSSQRLPPAAADPP